MKRADDIVEEDSRLLIEELMQVVENVRSVGRKLISTPEKVEDFAPFVVIEMKIRW